MYIRRILRVANVLHILRLLSTLAIRDIALQPVNIYSVNCMKFENGRCNHTKKSEQFFRFIFL